MSSWNPWHGCEKISPGCRNCYVFRRDESFDKDASKVHKTADFDLPIKKNRSGEYKLTPDGDFCYTCFTSDFFVPQADGWREAAYSFMKERSDLLFYIITKRPERFYKVLPTDWGDGYDNVYISCTVENNEFAHKRLPVYLDLPIKHKSIVVEPMLEEVDLTPFFEKYKSQIECVTVGGESGDLARLCEYDWVLSLRESCVKYNVAFHYHQTGARLFVGDRLYNIPRRKQMSQARKAGIDFTPKTVEILPDYAE